MKILFNLQLSSVDASTGLIKITSDSNWNFNNYIIKGLQAVDKDIIIGLIIPNIFQIYEYATSDVNDLSKYFNNFSYNEKTFINNLFITEIDLDRIIIFQNQNIINAYLSRFNFNVNDAITVLNTFKPDIIWENDPMKVQNWKICLYHLGLLDKVKVVCYNHWIDNDKFPKIDRRCSYTIRQIEGTLNSDLAMFNSQFAIEMMKDGIKDNFCNNKLEAFKQKTLVLPPPIDPEIYYNEKKHESLSIMFNHRMSSLPYYNENWERTILVCKELINCCCDLNLYVTDPSNKIKNDSDIAHYDFIIPLKNLSYKEYLKQLSKCHIHLTMFNKGNGGMWSISAVDAALSNNITFLPYHSGYKEIMHDNYDYYYKSLYELKNKLLHVIRIMNQYGTPNSSITDRYNKDYLQSKLHYKIIANKFLNAIGGKK